MSAKEVTAAYDRRIARDLRKVLDTVEGRRTLQLIVVRICEYDDDPPDGSSRDRDEWIGRRGVAVKILRKVATSQGESEDERQAGKELVNRMRVEFTARPAPGEDSDDG